MFLADALKKSYISDSIYKPTGRLVQVSGFESEYAGQIIEGYDIWAFDNPVILNHKVIFRDCRIRYAGGRAMHVTADAADSEIYNLNVGYMGNPRTSPPFAVGESREAFFLDAVPGLTVSRIKFNGGSLPIFGENCTELKLDNIQAANIFGNGLMHLNGCPEAVLDNFSMVNDVDACFTEDLIKLYESNGSILRKGLLDGSNSVNGYALNLELSSNCLVEDVDIVHVGNGNLINEGLANTYRNVRMRDFHSVGKGGRSAPANPDAYSFEYVDPDTQSGTRWHNCKYYNIPAIADPETDLPDPTMHDQIDIQEEDFVPREPLNQSWVWEEVLQGPFALIIINNDGGDTLVIDQNFPPDTVIGKLYYESSYSVDDAVFSIVGDQFNKFYLDGDELLTSSVFYYDQTPSVTLVLRAENSMGKSFQQSFVIAVDEDIGDAPPNYVLPALGSLLATSEISEIDSILENFVLGNSEVVQSQFMLDQLFFVHHPLFALDSIETDSYITVKVPIVMTAQFEISELDIVQQHAFSLNSLAAEFYVKAKPFNYMEFDSLEAQFTMQNLAGFQSNKYIPLTSITNKSYVAMNYINLTSITSTSEISELEIET